MRQVALPTEELQEDMVVFFSLRMRLSSLLLTVLKIDPSVLHCKIYPGGDSGVIKQPRLPYISSRWRKTRGKTSKELGAV